MLSEANLKEVLPQLPLEVQSGWAYRAVEARFMDNVNSVVGSLRRNGRFHRAQTGIGTLYLGLNRESLLFEVQSITQTVFLPHLLPPAPLDTVPFLLQLMRVLDLTDPGILRSLDTGIQELTGSWRYENDLYGLEAASQRLARVAAQQGIQALRYLSARTDQLVNLAIFVTNVSEPLQAMLSLHHPKQKVDCAQATPELGFTQPN